jgi:hypothetical protein
MPGEGGSGRGGFKAFIHPAKSKMPAIRPGKKVPLKKFFIPSS